jgi:hypothetical protein
VGFYDPKTAPAAFDVVWCKWPRREDKLGPGPWVRCVLVLDVRPMVDLRTGVEYVAITSAYGTGAENVSARDLAEHLYISRVECAALGLHKPTVFKLDLASRKRLPWASDYFVTQGYVRAQKMVSGSLNKRQQGRVLTFFSKHSLTFPLP